MNNYRFTALLLCGMSAVLVIAGPSWLRYWQGGVAGPTLGQLSYLTEKVEYWNPAGYETSGKAKHDGDVKVTTRFFKSRVLREPAAGPKEQMVFAQVTVENESKAPVYLYDLKVNGFDNGVQIFSIPVMRTTDHAESLTGSMVPRVFNSEGIFIPAYLIHDEISAALTLTNKPLNVTF